MIKNLYYIKLKLVNEIIFIRQNEV